MRTLNAIARLATSSNEASNVPWAWSRPLLQCLYVVQKTAARHSANCRRTRVAQCGTNRTCKSCFTSPSSVSSCSTILRSSSSSRSLDALADILSNGSPTPLPDAGCGSGSARATCGGRSTPPLPPTTFLFGPSASAGWLPSFLFFLVTHPYKQLDNEKKERGSLSGALPSARRSSGGRQTRRAAPAISACSGPTDNDNNNNLAKCYFGRSGRAGETMRLLAIATDGFGRLPREGAVESLRGSGVVAAKACRGQRRLPERNRSVLAGC